MRKTKSYRFSTEITPETQILLGGRTGGPLSLSLDDGISVKAVRLDTESIIRLQTFLSDFLQEEEISTNVPQYIPTGRAIAVMDGNTLDIVKVFPTAGKIGFDQAEKDSYEVLCEKVRTLADTDIPSKAIFIFFDTFDGSISRSVIRRILRACISYQVDFVRTGDFSRCRRMLLNDIEDFTTIDKSIISRATKDVVVLSPSGVFTLNSRDTSLDVPSLFDEGSRRVNGKNCSRKEVLSVLKDLIVNEDNTNPLTDEEIKDTLFSMGYDIARRTVTKYREILGFAKRADRRI